MSTAKSFKSSCQKSLNSKFKSFIFCFCYKSSKQLLASTQVQVTMTQIHVSDLQIGTFLRLSLLFFWTHELLIVSMLHNLLSCPSVEIVSIDGGLRGSGPLTGTYLEWQLCFSVSQRGTVIRLGKARARMVNVSYHFGDTVIQIVLQYHEWTECFGSSKFGSLYITCSDHRVMQNQKIL